MSFAKRLRRRSRLRALPAAVRPASSNWCAQSSSPTWNEIAMLKIAWPCCTATTRRVVKSGRRESGRPRTGSDASYRRGAGSSRAANVRPIRRHGPRRRDERLPEHLAPVHALPALARAGRAIVVLLDLFEIEQPDQIRGGEIGHAGVTGSGRPGPAVERAHTLAGGSQYL